MKLQTRNRLIVLLIVLFPIVVLAGFILSEALHPQK